MNDKARQQIPYVLGYVVVQKKKNEHGIERESVVSRRFTVKEAAEIWKELAEKDGMQGLRVIEDYGYERR